MIDFQLPLGVDRIQEFLPHRAPFLLLDRILEIESNVDLNSDPLEWDIVGSRVLALKNVSFNEPFFQGHFPSYAIMPGVLLIESMAQTASFSIYPYMIKDRDQFKRDFQCILVGVNKARFRKPVIPGDSIKIESRVIKNHGMLWVFDCAVSVGEQKVAEAEILANLLASRNSSSKVKPNA